MTTNTDTSVKEIREKLAKMDFYNPGLTRWLKLSDDEIDKVMALFDTPFSQSRFDRDQAKRETAIVNPKTCGCIKYCHTLLESCGGDGKTHCYCKHGETVE